MSLYDGRALFANDKEMARRRSHSQKAPVSAQTN